MSAPTTTLAPPRRDPKAPKNKMKFRLLVGMHQQNDPSGEMEESGEFHPVTKEPIMRPRTITYHKGDEFESETDLVARFNQPGSQKFERIDFTAVEVSARLFDPARETIEQFSERMRAMTVSPVSSVASPVASPVQAAAQAGFATTHTDVYQSMSLAELRKFAEGEEIDLRGATRKDEIIKIIVDSQAAAAKG